MWCARSMFACLCAVVEWILSFYMTLFLLGIFSLDFLRPPRFSLHDNCHKFLHCDLFPAVLEGHVSMEKQKIFRTLNCSIKQHVCQYLNASSRLQNSGQRAAKQRPLLQLFILFFNCVNGDKEAPQQSYAFGAGLPWEVRGSC